MSRTRNRKRSLDLFILPVRLMPVRTWVRWAEGPQEVDETDWTQGLPPMDHPQEHLPPGSDEEPNATLPYSPIAPPETLRYPRLVRNPLIWVDQRASQPAPLRALGALKQVYRALREDPKPCDPKSPTREAIQKAAMEGGLLTSFRQGWIPGEWGVAPLVPDSLYDDNLFSWIAAAYLVYALRGALGLVSEGFPPDEALSKLYDRLQRRKGKEYPDCPLLEEAQRLGLDSAERIFWLITSFGLQDYRLRLIRQFGSYALVDEYEEKNVNDLTSWSVPALPPGFGRPKEPSQGHRNPGFTVRVQPRSLRPRKLGVVHAAYLSILDLAIIGITASEARTCQYCGNLIVGKRRDAKFCSNKCRVAFFRERGKPRSEEDLFLGLEDQE